jgi:hypothetical protein
MSPKRINEDWKNDYDENSMESLLEEQIGEKFHLIALLKLYALLLRMAMLSNSDIPVMAERIIYASSELLTLLQSTSDRTKELISSLKKLQVISMSSNQPDMFGGMGHFDLDGEYHFD